MSFRKENLFGYSGKAAGYQRLHGSELQPRLSNLSVSENETVYRFNRDALPVGEPDGSAPTVLRLSSKLRPTQEFVCMAAEFVVMAQAYCQTSLAAKEWYVKAQMAHAALKSSVENMESQRDVFTPSDVLSYEKARLSELRQKNAEDYAQAVELYDRNAEQYAQECRITRELLLQAQDAIRLNMLPIAEVTVYIDAELKIAYQEKESQLAARSVCWSLFCCCQSAVIRDINRRINELKTSKASITSPKFSEAQQAVSLYVGAMIIKMQSRIDSNLLPVEDHSADHDYERVARQIDDLHKDYYHEVSDEVMLALLRFFKTMEHVHENVIPLETKKKKGEKVSLLAVKSDTVPKEVIDAHVGKMCFINAFYCMTPTRKKFQDYLKIFDKLSKSEQASIVNNSASMETKQKIFPRFGVPMSVTFRR